MSQDLQAQIDTLRSQLAELAGKTRRLEAERGVLDTLYLYGHALDYGDEAGWADCFTIDGAFDVRVRPGLPKPYFGQGTEHDSGVRYEGRAVLLAYAARHPRPPAGWPKHLVAQPTVTLDGDGVHATARSYFLRMDDLEGRSELTAFGRYLDDMVLGEDGRWRFQRRIAQIEALGAAFWPKV